MGSSLCWGDRAAANRVFVWTTRFRHEAATQRLKWLTESFHRHAPTNALTSTLVADHPHFGGSGLGMGMDRENTTWGGSPLSLDWFGLARERVVDVIGIEDWLGLQYMYGPHSTWEGFQLIGFQAAMFRSGSRGELPIITWITPSDETNLRLKSASALCQGAKHFFCIPHSSARSLWRKVLWRSPPSARQRALPARATAGWCVAPSSSD